MYGRKEAMRRFIQSFLFCILTPQSKAVNAWKAITTLRDNGLLFNGTAEEMVEYLNIVRFKNNKSKISCYSQGTDEG